MPTLVFNPLRFGYFVAWAVVSNFVAPIIAARERGQFARIGRTVAQV